MNSKKKIKGIFLNRCGFEKILMITQSGKTAALIACKHNLCSVKGFDSLSETIKPAKVVLGYCGAWGFEKVANESLVVVSNV